MTMLPISSIFEQYENYREKRLSSSKFKHGTVKKIISSLPSNKMLSVKKVGNSFEGREIFLIRFGMGEKKIFLWTQMHGDEPTATMTVFDLLNFFLNEDGFNELKNFLAEKVSVYFLPMLNPDGAEKFVRRNAQGIDLNRDARALVTPEAKLLDSLIDSIKPDVALNLHDQSFRYSVGKTQKPAFISLLAPPFNSAKEVNSTRAKAIKIVVEIFQLLNFFVGGSVARYKDDFEPRSFGDVTQGKGIPTVLIESGRNFNDPDTKFSRKLNFVALLKIFHSIATDSYLKANPDDYEKIPFNGEEYFDLILRNVKKGNSVFDVGINRDEIKFSSDVFYLRGTVADIGDLKNRWGMEEIDAADLELVQPKVYTETFSEIEDVNFEIVKKALSSYSLFLPLKKKPKSEFTNLPINFISENKQPLAFPTFEASANAIFKKGGKISFFVLNGFVVKSINELDFVKNGLCIG